MSDNCTEEEKKYCEKFIYKNACKDGKCYNPKRKQVSNRRLLRSSLMLLKQKKLYWILLKN